MLTKDSKINMRYELAETETQLKEECQLLVFLNSDRELWKSTRLNH